MKKAIAVAKKKRKSLKIFLLSGGTGRTAGQVLEAALAQFIEKLTEINGGRAFYTTNESLGDYVLVDFLEHRRRLTQRQAG